MVKMVKIKSFDDFIYLFVSKRIMKLISDNEAARIIILVKKIILENTIIKINKNTDKGNRGWKPLNPTLYLIKFKKSIPKHDLWSKKPKNLLSLWCI